MMLLRLAWWEIIPSTGADEMTVTHAQPQAGCKTGNLLS